MPGEAGAFAAAIAVGDRSEVPQQALQALRDSNLAHLLAISGLHMAMLCGAAFAALRYGLVLIPRAALFLPVKRLAAGGALCVGVAYLLLSGAGTPTQRAFVMVAAALVGAMTNRPAVTLRALALAALIVLLVAPESLLSAGFQMSFAATLALVAVYDEARRRGWSTPPRGALATVRRYALAIAATSLVAGLATAPFAAEHFNRLTTYGFFANLLATPALGLWAAPALLGAAILAPVGLEAPFLAVAAAGVDWILGVAAWFARAENAVRPIVTAPAAAWAAVALGGLWLALWRSAIRWCGAVAVAAGVAIWAFGADRPDVLIAPGGGLVGVMTEAGRSLNQGRSERYAAESWLKRDGDGASPADAAARPLWRESGDAATAQLADGRALIVLDRSARRAAVAAVCADGALVLAPHRTFSDQPQRCALFDRSALEKTGALSVATDKDGLRIETALDPLRARLWSVAPQ
jgi:competence protein ComEC